MMNLQEHNLEILVEPFYQRCTRSEEVLLTFAVVFVMIQTIQADVIDRNEFRADIFIKPARSINFIQLNFVATRTGVAFSEVAGA